MQLPASQQPSRVQASDRFQPAAGEIRYSLVVIMPAISRRQFPCRPLLLSKEMES